MDNSIFVEFLVNNPPIRQIKNCTGINNEYGEKVYVSGFFRCDGCLTVFYDDSTKEYRNDKDNHREDCPYRLAVEAKQNVINDEITPESLEGLGFTIESFWATGEWLNRYSLIIERDKITTISIKIIAYKNTDGWLFRADFWAIFPKNITDLRNLIRLLGGE